jgi:hypothetical protein
LDWNDNVKNDVKRTAITAADLYVLLQREFRRRQVPECSTCYIQLPFRVDNPNHAGANWEIVFPAECVNGCREVLDEVVEDFSHRYDLLPETAN